jgi:hypothetical protein
MCVITRHIERASRDFSKSVYILKGELDVIFQGPVISAWGLLEYHIEYHQARKMHLSDFLINLVILRRIFKIFG